MAEVQVTKKPSQSGTPRADVTPYGIVKKIRYMVNSTPEFMEVLHGVNQMFGHVENIEDNKSLQQACLIDVIPLPHSDSKFIFSFMVPSDLLGAVRIQKAQKIDFAEFYDPKDKPQIIKKSPKMLFSYDVDSLFDLNLAFYNFQATLAPAVPTAQWSRIRRSIEVISRPRQNPTDKLKIIIITEVNAAIEA